MKFFRNKAFIIIFIGLAIFGLVVGNMLINKVNSPEVTQNKENVTIGNGMQAHLGDISIAVGNIRGDEKTKSVSAGLWISFEDHPAEVTQKILHKDEEIVVEKYKIKVLDIKIVPNLDPRPGSDKSYVTLELTKLD